MFPFIAGVSNSLWNHFLWPVISKFVLWLHPEGVLRSWDPLKHPSHSPPPEIFKGSLKSQMSLRITASPSPEHSPDVTRVVFGGVEGNV